MIIGQEVSYVRELIEHIKDNNITSFKELVDYVYSLEIGNGYNDEYLELILEYTDFFVQYLNIGYIQSPESKDMTREQFLRAVEEMRL